MIPKQKSWLYFVFSLILLIGCENDPVQESTESFVGDQTELSDSLFGSISAKEQYYQHFLVDIPASFQLNIDTLSNWIQENQPGALNFIDWEQDSLTALKSRLDTLLSIKPIYYANYFDYLDLPKSQYWDVNEKNRSLNWILPFENDHIGLISFDYAFYQSDFFKKWTTDWAEKNGAQFVIHQFHDKNVKSDYEKFIRSLKTSSSCMQLELTYLDTVNLDIYRQRHNFKGLFIVSADEEAMNEQLIGGADFLRVSLENNLLNPIPYQNWEIDETNRQSFDRSTKRILQLKSAFNFPQIGKRTKELREAVRLNLAVKAGSIIQNLSKNLPLKNGATFFSEQSLDVDQQIKTENKLKFVTEKLSDISKMAKQDGVKILLLSDAISEQQRTQINQLKKDENTIICFSNPALYSELKSTPNLVYIPSVLREKENNSLFVQQFTGQLSFSGDYVLADSIVKGIQTEKLKLARTSPAFCGLSKDTLRNIDYAVQAAMNGMAFPGCQVLLSKNGCIFYNRSFGHSMYDRQTPVTAESMYDVASLTKVVATTMVGMLLYEQNAYHLSDSLKDYLPDSLKNYLAYPSTIRNITFQELFTHQSGLPAGFPVIRYMQYTNSEIGRLDKYYCDRPDSIYTIEVAENFFLEGAYRDSMWVRLNQMYLDPSKEYKYSDVNMNTLYFIFKSILHNNPGKYGYNLKKNERLTRDLFVEFLYEKLYNPLGMSHTRYKPLKYFNKNQIIPTENERYWRRQLLHGHVHDPNAALYGGIGGNAGIFSTANDLAILCDMLLQKGVYNGQRYFKAETVEKFTSAQPNTFRGLGFNKPSINTSAFGCADSAPQATYGHTGFTGTCFWVDPINKITFVFLSNRVYPEVNNRIYQYGIRKRVHQFAYEADLFVN